MSNSGKEKRIENLTAKSEVEAPLPLNLKRGSDLVNELFFSFLFLKFAPYNPLIQLELYDFDVLGAVEDLIGIT